MEEISLPEEIMHHIFSFLRLEEGIHASLLSKAWLRAWRTRSLLDLDIDITRKRFFDDNSEEYIEFEQSFYRYVDQTLIRYKDSRIPIQIFKLSTTILPCRRWLETVIGNGVNKLQLTISLVADQRHTFPEVIFQGENLQDLCINGNTSDVNLQIPENVMCHRLRLLKLASMSLDEVGFQRIISTCKMIEFLELDSCEGIENFKVNQLPNLKSFSIFTSQHKRVEVEAQNLEIFRVRNLTFGGGRVWLNLSSASRNLKRLELSYHICFTDKKMFDFGYKFPCLEDLMIRSCEHFQIIKISSQTLKNLELECCYPMDSLKQLNVDAPNLVGFQYYGVLVPVNVSFTCASGHCWVSVIEINSSETREIFWFLLKKFLSKLSQSEIYLCIRFISDVTFNLEVEEMNDIELLELEPQVQELRIKCEQSCQVETALEGIFWVCHPKTIKQLSSGHDVSNFLAFHPN